MAESSLTRVGSNTYTGMLLEKSDQPEWRTPTMLALFIDASGSECAFFLTSEAREQFSDDGQAPDLQHRYQGELCQEQFVRTQVWG